MADSSVGAVEVVSALQNIARILNRWVASTTMRMTPTGLADGTPLRVAATAAPGNLFHASHRQPIGSRSGPPEIDLVYLWAINTDNNNRTVTLLYGGVPIAIQLAGHEVKQLLPGTPISSGKEIRAFASLTNVIILVGWITREGGIG